MDGIEDVLDQVRQPRRRGLPGLRPDKSGSRQRRAAAGRRRSETRSRRWRSLPATLRPTISNAPMPRRMPLRSSQLTTGSRTAKRTSPTANMNTTDQAEINDHHERDRRDQDQPERARSASASACSAPTSRFVEATSGAATAATVAEAGPSGSTGSFIPQRPKGRATWGKGVRPSDNGNVRTPLFGAL